MCDHLLIIKKQNLIENYQGAKSIIKTYDLKYYVLIKNS